MRLRGALAVLAVGVASCSGAPEGRGASAPGEQPFAVFTKGQLVIDRLGMPFAPPITVGSTASPQTLRSDAPEIVEVDAAGALVGRRNGRALVRSPTDPAQVLEVEVRAASALAVSPAVIKIRPGGAAHLKLVSGGGGEEVPAEAAVWATTRPDVAMVVGGRVEAGPKTGTATVTVTYGGQAATAQVVVAEEPGPAFSVRPQAPSLRVGQAVTFEAVSPRGPVEARWAAKEPQFLARSGPSTFVAVAPGRVSVCGEAGGRAACTTVIVRGP